MDSCRVELSFCRIRAHRLLTYVCSAFLLLPLCRSRYDEDEGTPEPFVPVNPQAHVACAINIHPVMRVYVKGTHVETLHLKVTLDGHWTTPDVRLAVRHFFNRHLHIEEYEPDASKPFDFYRTPEAQHDAMRAGGQAAPATMGPPAVPPQANAEFLVNVKGAIVSPSFDERRPCRLPTGTARLEAPPAQ